MAEFQVSTAKAASEFEESYEDEQTIRGAIFTEPLSKVPRRPLVTVSPASTVAETIAAMNEKHSGVALVVFEGRLVGIFTERDVLTKVAAQNLPPTTLVREVMTADPDTLPPTAGIAYALRHMSVEGYRHIPIADESGRPIGVVAVRDIVNWMVSLFPQSVLNLPPTPKVPTSSDGG